MPDWLDAVQETAHAAMTADYSNAFTGPQAFTVLAEVHAAADFDAEGHDKTLEAAQISELLYWLLHPKIDQRMTGRFVDEDRLPWLYACRGQPVPECPISALSAVLQMQGRAECVMLSVLRSVSVTPAGMLQTLL